MAKTKSVTSGDGQDKVSYIRGWPRQSQLHPGRAKTKSVTSGDGKYKVSYIRGWPRQSQLHPGMAKTKSFTSGDGIQNNSTYEMDSQLSLKLRRKRVILHTQTDTR